MPFLKNMIINSHGKYLQLIPIEDMSYYQDFINLMIENGILKPVDNIRGKTDHLEFEITNIDAYLNNTDV